MSIHTNGRVVDLEHEYIGQVDDIAGIGGSDAKINPCGQRSVSRWTETGSNVYIVAAAIKA